MWLLSVGYALLLRSYSQAARCCVKDALKVGCPATTTPDSPLITYADIYGSRGLSGKMNWPDTTPPTVPVIEPKFLPNRSDSTSLRATWLGHACYYVEFPGGLRVLFDPVFEDRCSPFSFIGPKRYTKVPCHIKDLPVVDVVAISHSHYGTSPLRPLIETGS